MILYLGVTGGALGRFIGSFFTGDLDLILGAVITLFILSVLILVHEIGHFIAAKKLGIKIEEFGFGFPLTKAIFQVKRGETLYSFYPALIGGFVKLYGEDEAGGGKVELKNEKGELRKENFKEDLERAFFARPVWQRALVVVAGVLMNALLAFIIYYVFLGISGFRVELPRISDHKFIAVNQEDKLNTIIINNVSADSPADKAGIKKCDTNYCVAITKVNGVAPASADEFIKTIRVNQGKEVTLTLENQVGKKEAFETVLVPRVNPPKNQGALGVEFSMLETFVLTYSTPVQKIASGVTHPVNLMTYNFNVLKTLIKRSFETNDARGLASGLSGPVGIVRLGAEINKIGEMKERILTFLNLAGLLSISLAVTNVLPIPAMDGGRLFFILIEGITRKKVSPKLEAAIHAGGIFVLVALIILITFKDIFFSF